MVKRVNNLSALITDRQNIRLAWLKAIKGKRKAADVLSFQNDFLSNIERVRERLMSADPGWGKYRSFLVRDPKLRVINAAALPERIMHHAIMNILEPVFERFQVFHSYACRKGKGTHAAVLHAFRQTKKFGFYLKLDVRKYFDSIDHRILMRQITRLIKDEQVLLLFHGIISSYSTGEGRGLPIGNLTSQYFANHYLAGLDHYILEKLAPGGYVRYMDDMVIWHSDFEKLKHLLEAVKAFCSNELNIELKQAVMGAVSEGVPFLGFMVRPSGIFLLGKSKRRMKKRAWEIAEELAAGLIDEGQAALRATSVNAGVLIARSRAFRARLWKENSHGLEPCDTRRQLEQFR